VRDRLRWGAGRISATLRPALRLEQAGALARRWIRRHQRAAAALLHRCRTKSASPPAAAPLEQLESWGCCTLGQRGALVVPERFGRAARAANIHPAAQHHTPSNASPTRRASGFGPRPTFPTSYRGRAASSSCARWGPPLGQHCKPQTAAQQSLNSEQQKEVLLAVVAALLDRGLCMETAAGLSASGLFHHRPAVRSAPPSACWLHCCGDGRACWLSSCPLWDGMPVR